MCDSSGSGVSLKSHGRIGAQREFELKDGAKRRRLRRSPVSALTRVFDALWAILDFEFSLRLRSSVRFKGRWLHSSDFSHPFPRSCHSLWFLVLSPPTFCIGSRRTWQ